MIFHLLFFCIRVFADFFMFLLVLRINLNNYFDLMFSYV